MLVGLTGGIASGKSTIARMFVERGAALVDADVLAHAVLEPGQAAYDQVVAEFGPGILEPDGRIDRQRLGGIVFADGGARARLEGIVHPAVKALARAEVAAREAEGFSVVVLDAPLLIEAGLLDWVQRLVVVSVDAETQLARLMARDGLDRAAALRRVESQMPLADKVRLADYVIDNSGGLDATRVQVDKVWEDILKWGKR